MNHASVIVFADIAGSTALYERLRTLSERAENIRVDTDNGLTVYYDLEGTEQVLEIE